MEKLKVVPYCCCCKNFKYTGMPASIDPEDYSNSTIGICKITGKFVAEEEFCENFDDMYKGLK